MPWPNEAGVYGGMPIDDGEPVEQVRRIGRALTRDERDTLRDAAYQRRLTAEHLPLIAKLADELDEENAACAASVVRALVDMAIGPAGGHMPRPGDVEELAAR